MSHRLRTSFALAAILLPLAFHAQTQVSQPQCTPVPPGMVSWFPGDGNGKDITGGQTVAAQGFATFGLGEVGQAFDMVAAGDGFLAPDSPIWHLQQLAVDAWVNATGSTGAGGDTIGGVVAVKVLKDFPHTFPFNSWWLSYQPQTGKFFTIVEPGYVTGAASDYLQSAGNFAAGQWHHVAMTYDGLTLSLYVNGTLQGLKTIPGPIQYSSIGRLGIGSHAFGTYPFDRTLIGEVDEVEILNRALSANEIQAIYTAGSAGKCKSCQASDDLDRVPINFPQAQLTCGVPVLTCANRGGLQPLPGGDGQGCLIDETATDSRGAKFQVWCGYYRDCGLINGCLGFYRIDGGATITGKCWFHAGSNDVEVEKSRSKGCYLSSHWANMQSPFFKFVEPDPGFPNEPPGTIHFPDGKTDTWIYDYSSALNKTSITVLKDFSQVFHQDPSSGAVFNDLPPVLQGFPDEPGDKTIRSVSQLCDINHDGKCDSLDLSTFRDALGKCRGDSGYNALADVNGDGCVTPADGRALLRFMGDVNGDGNVDCQDLNIVKAAFGKRLGQNGYDPRADLNQDGIVDIKDLAFVAQHLPAGTRCP